MQYLKGVDENITSVAGQMQEMTTKAKEVVDLMSQEVRESVSHLKSFVASADDVAHELKEIGKLARRSQRDAMLAQERFVGKLQRSPDDSSSG
jgi:methyl-accepting chemotaxis protein